MHDGAAVQGRASRVFEVVLYTCLSRYVLYLTSALHAPRVARSAGRKRLSTVRRESPIALQVLCWSAGQVPLLPCVIVWRGA